SHAKFADVAVGTEHDLVVRLSIGEADTLDPPEQDDSRDLRKWSHSIEALVDLRLVVIVGCGQVPLAKIAKAEPIGGNQIEALRGRVEAVDEKPRCGHLRKAELGKLGCDRGLNGRSIAGAAAT